MEGDGSPPSSEMTLFTLFSKGPILSVSCCLNPAWSLFQDLIMGIKAAISEDTEDALDVAWALPSRLVGGRVTGGVDDGWAAMGIVKCDESCPSVKELLVEAGIVRCPGGDGCVNDALVAVR